MDITTKTLVQSIAIGVAERLAIVAGTWLVTQKLLPVEQLTNAETVIGTGLLALGVFAYTWWREHGRYTVMQQLKMEVPPGYVPANAPIADPAPPLDMNGNLPST